MGRDENVYVVVGTKGSRDILLTKTSKMGKRQMEEVAFSG